MRRLVLEGVASRLVRDTRELGRLVRGSLLWRQAGARSESGEFDGTQNTQYTQYSQQWSEYSQLSPQPPFREGVAASRQTAPLPASNECQREVEAVVGAAVRHLVEARCIAFTDASGATVGRSCGCTNVGYRLSFDHFVCSECSSKCFRTFDVLPLGTAIFASGLGPDEGLLLDDEPARRRGSSSPAAKPISSTRFTCCPAARCATTCSSSRKWATC